MLIREQRYVLSVSGLTQVWFDFADVPPDDPDFLIGVLATEDYGGAVVNDIVNVYYLPMKGSNGFALGQGDLIHNFYGLLLPKPIPLCAPAQLNVNYVAASNLYTIVVRLLTAKRKELL